MVRTVGRELGSSVGSRVEEEGDQLHIVHCTIFLRSPASRQSRESTGCATDSRTERLPIRGNHSTTSVMAFPQILEPLQCKIV